MRNLKKYILYYAKLLNNILSQSLFIFVLLNVFAVAQWTKNIGGQDNDYGISILLDGKSNLLVTGHFQGTINFDSTADTVNVTSSGEYDIFLAKYNSDGNLVWANKMGGVLTDYVTSLTIDESNNIYLTGFFGGGPNDIKNYMADFDPGEGILNLTSSGKDDIFLAKYNSDGNLVWANKIGGTLKDYGSSITVDNNGYIYLTGFFQDIADFDPSDATMSLKSLGYEDIFLAKYNSDGSLVWAKSMGSYKEDFGQEIKVSKSGDVYITGYFVGVVDFDPSSTVFNLQSKGGSDIFLAKYDSDGYLNWAKNVGNKSYDYPQSIEIDEKGDIFISGNFKGAVDFSPGDSDFNLISSGDYDIFFAKYGSDGSFKWAKNIGGNLGDFDASILLDKNYNIYLTGSFEGTADFDPSTNVFNLQSEGGSDIFIAKYNSNSVLLWAASMGGTLHDYPSSMSLNKYGDLYLTGDFQGTADFDPSINVFNLQSEGGSDIFIAKYNTNGNLEDNLSTNINYLPFKLYGNYPNPFNTNTTIKFYVDEPTNIRFAIYNILGENIKTFNYDYINVGHKSIIWDGTNDKGRKVVSGIYILNFQSNSKIINSKMILIK